MIQADGALLIDKHAGVSSFGIIERLQDALIRKHGVKKRDLPKLGHGGTLDPFATGLLIVCSGRAVKLARYFLDSAKEYRGVMRFGETTLPGDPTDPISERTERLPQSIESLRELAANLTKQPYLQLPPMHSAKKVDGKPLYLLAREGIEIEREPKLCHLYEFEVESYETPRARFRLKCSSGTYVRTLAQDYARLQGSLALLESLERAASGAFRVDRAMKVAEVAEATQAGTPWDELPCWVPFDRLLESSTRAQATQEEMDSIFQGRQAVLINILNRAAAPLASPAEDPEGHIAIYHQNSLIAIARMDHGRWGLERVFPRGQ